MGIDRIGSKGPPVPSTEAHAPARPGEASRPFEVTRPPAADPAQGVAPVRTALDQVRAGQIDVHRYVDLKVEEATAHLQTLPPAQLEAIRAALRDRMATDPALVELLQTAAGGALPPAQED